MFLFCFNSKSRVSPRPLIWDGISMGFARLNPNFPLTVFLDLGFVLRLKQGKWIPSTRIEPKNLPGSAACPPILRPKGIRACSIGSLTNRTKNKKFS